MENEVARYRRVLLGKFNADALCRRAYWSRAPHARLAVQGILAVVAKPDSPHGSGLGGFRWIVEPTLAWLHRFRRIVLRPYPLALPEEGVLKMYS